MHGKNLPQPMVYKQLFSTITFLDRRTCLTHFSSFSDSLCFSTLARAVAPVSVRPLALRLQ